MTAARIVNGFLRFRYPSGGVAGVSFNFQVKVGGAWKSTVYTSQSIALPAANPNPQSAAYAPVPLTVFTTADGFAILLTYGPDRDWLKNITKSGGGKLTRRGQTYDVVDPRVVSKEEAAPLVTGALRKVFPRLPFEQAVLLRRA